jgi:DNA-binding winged helix-turn-helix (wHTH) protein
MLVLAKFIRRPGQLVTVEQILAAAWPNRVVGRDSVTTAIYQLRQLLGDNSERPQYIRSEPRRGYRLIAPVSLYRRSRILAAVPQAAGIALLLTFALTALIAQQSASAQRILLVEPMRDATESALPAPLSLAIESTLLSELIIGVPARVMTDLGNNEEPIRLQSLLVTCDRGPALLVRLLDTRDNAYVWSKAYSLNEAAAEISGPTLVQQVAHDVGQVFAAL